MTKNTTDLMRKIPNEEKKKETPRRTQLSVKESVDTVHPDCPPFKAFFYQPGKPDRIKKVLRF